MNWIQSIRSIESYSLCTCLHSPMRCLIYLFPRFCTANGRTNEFLFCFTLTDITLALARQYRLDIDAEQKRQRASGEVKKIMAKKKHLHLLLFLFALKIFSKDNNNKIFNIKKVFLLFIIFFLRRFSFVAFVLLFDSFILFLFFFFIFIFLRSHRCRWLFCVCVCVDGIRWFQCTVELPLVIHLFKYKYEK